MSNELSISVQNLSKRFGAFRAVDDVSFDVRQGEIYGFLGANGAGKSTTIRMLCGLLAPTSGTAIVAGHNVSKYPEMVKQNIGYMSQKFALYGDLTPDENISLFGGLYNLSKKEVEKRRDELYALLDLKGKRNELAETLPRGYQQRLAFACAILHNPKIIFLDEPTGGVDPLQRRNFWDIIHTLSSQGITIFVTTHFLDEAEFCNRITLIVSGKIIATDSPTGLKSLLDDYEIFEIECEPAVLALDAMQKQNWVRQVSIFGSAIHASTYKTTDAPAEIKKVLTSQNVAVQRIERIVPSLEDVFLHLVEEKK